MPIRAIRRLLLVACLAATGCADGGLPASPGNDVVAIALVDVKPGRPPLNRLLVDVELRNDSAVPRWVLFPSNLPARGVGGVDHLEQRTAGPVIVGRFLGRAGTYALRLAPGARVTLRRLEVNWWRDRPDAQPEAVFDVQLAGEVTIGGEPMAGWFDGDPTISGSAVAEMDAARHTHSRRSPDGRELPVAAIGAVPVTLRLAVP